MIINISTFDQWTKLNPRTVCYKTLFSARRVRVNFIITDKKE